MPSARELIDDGADALQLLLEFAGPHFRVLLAPEVDEEAAAEIGAVGSRRHEHAGLQHQLRHADRAQPCRLAALIGAGDEEQVLAVRVDIVADDGPVADQRQARIVEAACAMPALPARGQPGQAGGRPLGRQFLLQVQAAHIERQLGPQHAEKTQDVVVGLGDGVGDDADPAVAELANRARAGLVAVGDAKAVSGPPFHQTLHPRPVVPVRPAQHMVGAGDPFAETRADQRAPPEFEPLDVRLDDAEIILGKFPPQHREQRAKPLRFKVLRLGLRRAAQPPQHPDEHPQHFDGAVQDRARVVAQEAPVVLSHALDRLDREIIDAAHDRRVREAIPQDFLPIPDRFDIAQAAENGGFGDLQQKGVLPRHRREQGLQPEVLHQIVGERRRLLRRVEVALPVHQEGLHDASRSRTEG